MECSTGVFLWSQTFNAVLTRPSFSVPSSSSHCKEWLFSSHLISHGLRLASGAAFPFSLAFRFIKCGIFYSWCVVKGGGMVPRPSVESILWPKWATTLQDSWTAVISRRSFSWEKKGQLSWVWCHCDGVTGLLTRWILIPALVVSNGSDRGIIVRLWISV